MNLRHFNLCEFACRCCGQLPPGGMSPVLLQKLDDMREEIGMPIIVTSGYRCPRHNYNVGGVSNSQHVKGNAADIYCRGLTVDRLAAYCVKHGFDGIGRYYGMQFVHVDVRDNGNSPNEYRWEG